MDLYTAPFMPCVLPDLGGPHLPNRTPSTAEVNYFQAAVLPENSQRDRRAFEIPTGQFTVCGEILLLVPAAVQ